MDSYMEQLDNYRKMLIDHINDLHEFLFETKEESNYVLDTTFMFSSVFLLCIFAASVYFMRSNQRKSLRMVRDKICKSEETINFLIETIEVINKAYQKSMHAADYIRMHKDRVSAQKLLDYLDLKEKLDAIETNAKQGESSSNVVEEEKSNQTEDEIQKRVVEDEKENLTQQDTGKIEIEVKTLESTKKENPKAIQKGEKFSASESLKKPRRSLICVRKTNDGKNNSSPSPVRTQHSNSSARKVSFSGSQIRA
uniref:Uncharacterized protein n=1 Tax=Glossina brevipalpis TaxID=37001 RepID=A0A1A9X341_9MUSC